LVSTVPIALLTALAALIGLGRAGPAFAAPSTGRSYYSADNTTDAYGGSGLTWHGTPGYGSGHTGAAGDRSFVVSSTNSLSVGDPTAGNFGTGAFTLHLYTRLAAGGIRREILSKRVGCAGGSFLDLRAGSSFGGVYFEIQDSATFGFHVMNSADVLDGSWHEITASRNGTVARLTVDGTTTSATSSAVINISNTAPMLFGDGPCTGVDGTTRGDGQLDDISFGPGTVVVGPPPPPTSPVPPPPASRSASTSVPSGTRHGPGTTAEAGPRASASGAGSSRPSSRAPTRSQPAAPARTGSAAAIPSQPSARTPSPAAPRARAGPAGPGPPARTSHQASVRFVESIPSPAAVESRPWTVAQNALLAILLLTLLALPIGVVNDTAEANSHRFAALTGRLRLRTTMDWTLPARFTLGLGAVAVAGAVIYSFVQPNLGVDLSSLSLVLGLAIAFVVLNLAKEGSRAMYLHRAFAASSGLRLFPAFTLVAVVCAVISRAIRFEPGLILGALAGLEIPSELSVAQKGKAATVAASAVAAVGLAAWFVRSDIGGGGFAATVVRVMLTAIVAAAAQYLAFGLVPLSFLGGAALFAWSKPVWAGFAGLGAFAFMHVLLHRTASSFTSRVTYLAVLLAIYLAAAAAFWAWFRFRPIRDDPSSAEPPARVDP
jgi:hypothetical protein